MLKAIMPVVIPIRIRGTTENKGLIKRKAVAEGYIKAWIKEERPNKKPNTAPQRIRFVLVVKLSTSKLIKNKIGIKVILKIPKGKKPSQGTKVKSKKILSKKLLIVRIWIFVFI